MRDGVQEIPPKMLAGLVERARDMDGCVCDGENTYKFAFGNLVSTVIGPLEHAVGHVRRDPKEAERLRSEIAALAQEDTHEG